MFIKCENGKGGYIWINVSQIKSVEEIYCGDGEIVSYYVKNLDNLEYRCGEVATMYKILHGGRD